jgi:hypothetical protein
MPKQIVVSSLLAKRLAEAADGYRDDRFHYFLSKLKYDFDLEEVSGATNKAASEAADKRLSELNKGKGKKKFEKFGPYFTKKEMSKPFEYDAIRLSFLKNQKEVGAEFFPGDTDALILSLAAYDKFFLPYYVRLYGLEVAAKMRGRARKLLKNIPVLNQSYPPPVTPNSYSYLASRAGAATHSERTLSS